MIISKLILETLQNQYMYFDTRNEMPSIAKSAHKTQTLLSDYVIQNAWIHKRIDERGNWLRRKASHTSIYKDGPIHLFH